MGSSASSVWVGLALVAILAGAETASAQAASADPPGATILTTQRTEVAPGDGAAFDRTLRARIDALGVVHTEGAVALDLEQIQLALGCLGETTECLASIAAETGTPIIVVPSLARAGGTMVATLLVFDARDRSLRRGTREVAAADATALLGSVEGLLRELFRLPAVEEGGPPDAPTPAPTAAVPGLSPAPLVVIGVGAAALIAGAVVGGLALIDASAFQNADLTSPMDVDMALDSLLARQRTEAMAADGLLIGGAIVVAAGLVWELVAGCEDGSSPLAVAPQVSSTAFGLALSGTFGGGL